MDDEERPRMKLEMGIDPASIRNDVRVILRARRAGNGQLIPLKRLPGKGRLGGVCAGIAYRVGCRPSAVRAAFILATVTFGLGLMLYVPLWLLLPRRKRMPKDFASRTGLGPDPDPDDSP
ncbi:MAG TPA: PspC domain-containing protein [Candidatus Baltobacteraceae bacterium]|nr:PspC domain-containing protein [Candidatus Baltobacteraceae bacterium]